MNQRKGNKVGLRQIQRSQKWHRAGLLSPEGMDGVVKMAARP
ncbi:MAG: hypothetical protein OSA84_05400 [Akkermansiaceae bacterium]|nr:hypothetical protein [Akkermansiaceae bacterium]